MSQASKNFEKQIVKTVRFKYLVYMPDDVEYSSDKKLPLILFLHGAGERGDDIDLVKKHGIPKLCEEMKLPFITVSPQCPEDSWWTQETEALKALLDEITANYYVDTDRIYLTGLSMGGFGTWEMAVHYPDLFAAIAPMCGGGKIEKAYLIKDLPIWVFHGAKDPVVPIENSKKMVDKLKELGSNVKFTVYPEAEHDCWTQSYSNPELYKWFLTHKKERKR